MKPQQLVGAAGVVFGAIMLWRAFHHREPEVIRLPPPTFTDPKPPPIDLHVPDPPVIPAPTPIAPRPVVFPDAAPPEPKFRASKPGQSYETPLAFPPDVPDAFTPAGFRARLEHAIVDCKMGDLAIVAIECDELPCAALTEARDERARTADLNDCPSWNYMHGTHHIEASQTRDGKPVHYRVWIPLPPDDDDSKIAMMRADRRAHALVTGRK
jgi:hypothetical protein